MTNGRRFSGVDRLYGAAALARFAESHVAIVGIGGVGSWAVEALARTGVGKMTLIDLDMIAESNTNRQLHALGDAYGRAKVEAMADRIVAINPACRVNAIEDFVTSENVADLLPTTLDFIVDAIDQSRVKVAIAAHCRRFCIPLAMSGAAGGKRDPTRIAVDDLARTTGDGLLSRVRQQLRAREGFPREPKSRFGILAVYSTEPVHRPPPACGAGGALSCTGYGSAVAVTGAFGFAAAAAALDALAKRP
jgi:tRNA A37 threonylcarbamoyladenosine dehydratase